MLFCNFHLPYLLPLSSFFWADPILFSLSVINSRTHREFSKTTKESEAKRLLKKREEEMTEGRIPGACFDQIRFNCYTRHFFLTFPMAGKRKTTIATRMMLREMGRVTKPIQLPSPMMICFRREFSASSPSISPRMKAEVEYLNFSKKYPIKVKINMMMTS